MAIDRKSPALSVLGWIGTALILLTYTLSSQGVLAPTSVWYLLLNMLGACGVGAISFVRRAYQPAVLNVIWALVAIYGLVKIITR